MLTLGAGEAVALLQGFQAINLRWRTRSKASAAILARPGSEEEPYKVNLLVDSITRPDPVKVAAHHGPRTIGGDRQRGKVKPARKDRPEEDVTGIPEDDWEADCGPDGHPGIRLGIVHHLVFWGVSILVSE